MDDLQGKMQELLSDPESMQQISELAAMLQGDGTAPENPPNFPDISMLSSLGDLMRSQGTQDKNTALLLALKPHLGERRQLRVDKAVKLLRLYSIWKTAKASGMLQDLL